jgi:pimeloyl-ACP methyl ester carboxylesterase
MPSISSANRDRARRRDHRWPPTRTPSGWTTSSLGSGAPSAGDVIGDDVGAFALLIALHFRPRTEPVPTFSGDALRQLAVPVMAVVGGRDAMLDSHATQRRLTAAVPLATVHLLPQAGRLLPDQTQPILEFLHSSVAHNPLRRRTELGQS